MEVLVKKSLRQRNLRMHFNDKCVLVISCPVYTTQDEINSFIEKNYKWINNQISKFVSHTYNIGDSFQLFGKQYLLSVEKSSRNNVSHDENTIFVLLPCPDDPDKVRKLLLKYYKESLLNYTALRVSYWANIMKLKNPVVEISNAKTTWGVCYSKKNLIRFSAMTAALEEDLIDMIVVHELCHIKYQNHSPLFWKEVSKYVPDLEQKKARLRQVSKTGICRNLF